MQPFSYDLCALWRAEVLRRINEARLAAADRNEPVPGRTAAVRPGGLESGRWWAIRPLRRVEARRRRSRRTRRWLSAP
jgi:hypothetical protein